MRRGLIVWLVVLATSVLGALVGVHWWHEVFVPERDAALCGNQGCYPEGYLFGALFVAFFVICLSVASALGVLAWLDSRSSAALSKSQAIGNDMQIQTRKAVRVFRWMTPSTTIVGLVFAASAALTFYWANEAALRLTAEHYTALCNGARECYLAAEEDRRTLYEVGALIMSTVAFFSGFYLSLNWLVRSLICSR